MSNIPLEVLFVTINSIVDFKDGHAGWSLGYDGKRFTMKLLIEGQHGDYTPLMASHTELQTVLGEFLHYAQVTR